ncbi:MAG TPA: fibrinogen-like YCDxxxxGGGW domain-containing protein [Kofleriaceae bacterium]|nr:fibrinogen-like YCDxxxxGGGW domain-containing protein [Kofleriaceae bacterium]
MSTGDDAGVDAGPVVDGPPSDAPGGSQDNPAKTCTELRMAGMPSGVYWLRDPATPTSAFQAYCEQQLNGGGWTLLENSVRHADGTTAAFWQFKYADRLKQLGTLAVDQNYYNGALYLAGKEYMDVFVDLQGKAAVAAVMTATGFNPATMAFTGPALTVGNMDVFTSQFASGWSSQDFDGDPDAANNCATLYNNIAQHYKNCFAYSLGSDAGSPAPDGFGGPHVSSALLSTLMLTPETSGGQYSQVNRIARFTRW